jgi:glycosyltransferase involved in cell wall biosynthesis
MSRVVVFNNMITPYTNRLYNELRRGGQDIIVLSCSRQEANRSWADAITPLYPHFVLPGRSFAISTGRYVHVNFGIVSVLARLKPDLLLINGFYPSMLIAALWAIITRTRLGLTIDGWRHTMPQSPLHRIIRPLILARCHAIVTCGLKGYEYFLEEGIPEKRIFTVPLVPAWPEPTLVPSFEERPFDILWCAQLNDDTKNAAFFLDVVLSLKPRLPNLRLRVVGRGPSERRFIDQLNQAGVNFKYEPVVAWDAMIEVFTSCKLLLLPSKWEPWGLVCNEAMQCGAPCVVSPYVGAGGDLVRAGENGAVIELDSDAWSDTVYAILNDPARWAQWSQLGRKEMNARQLDRSVTAFQAMISKVVHTVEDDCTHKEGSCA